MTRTFSQPAWLRIVLFASLSAAILFSAGSAARAGTIVADSGFRVDPNGFSFQNYGDQEGYRNLDGSQMRRLFGNAVCLVGKGSDCVLTSVARSWMEEINEAMAGGHCYGFAVLAWVIQRGQLPEFGYQSLAPFGPSSTAFGLDIESNPKLQATIARAWAFQTLDSVTGHALTGTPDDILQDLIRVLTPGNRNTFTMTIFQPNFEDGHAITPISVEDMGGGKYNVRVYDNNWPGDSNRELSIDTVSNTWSYSAATIPGRPDVIYRGNAKTNSLQLWPTRPGFKVQECPFCVGRQGAGSKFNEVSLSNAGDQHAHLLITDQKGRQTGFLRGRLVNRIPGARVIPRTAGGLIVDSNGDTDGSFNSLEPTYQIPKRLSLRIKVLGSNLTHNDSESLSVVGPTFDSSIDDILVGPRRNASVTLSPRKRTLTFTGSKVKADAKVSFGAQSKRASYRIRVVARGAAPGSTLFFRKRPRLGLLRIGEKTNASQRYRIQINRYTSRGFAKFARSYSIRGKQEAYLYYRPLASPTGMARIAIGKPGEKRIRVLKLRRIKND